jgi:GT2 family glycosyltransferase
MEPNPMETKAPLSWGLVIATYQREKILPICLKLAIEQTRPPAEIIVVDSSDYWETTRDRICQDLAVQHPDVRWLYVAAEERSSALQRNQGVRLATADIVFLIDDDSLMYPNCAEEIMRVYEADTDQTVQSVQALQTLIPPLKEVNDSKYINTESQSKSKSTLLKSLFFVSPIVTFVWKHLLLMNTEVNFIPYDGAYPQSTVPQHLQALNVEIARFISGFSMTFRRDAILREPLDPALRYYTAWEDVDVSYRLSRHGLLLTALDAKLHHYWSASGRINRFQIAALSALNQAVFLTRNSTNIHRDISIYRRLMARRILAAALKDILSRRWSLPQVQGNLLALKYSAKIFALPKESLTDWYPGLQEQVIAMQFSRPRSGQS